MTFIGMNAEKLALTQQKSLLEYEQMTYMNEYNDITEEMSEVSLDNEDGENDDYLAALQSQQELYDSKKEAIESQLEVMNAELESFDKAVSNNIKSECKMNLSV